MKNTFFDFIIKNRYVIICVSIVLILLFTGLLGFIIKAVAVVLLIMLAIYIGKKFQEDSNFFKDLFSIGKQKITYTVRDDDEKKDETKE